MVLASTEENGVLIVVPPEANLDAASSEEFKRAMAELIAQNPRIVLDMRNVDFLDSSGCGALLSCFRQTANAGGCLKVFNLRERVSALFDLLKLNQVIDVYASKEEALKHHE